MLKRTPLYEAYKDYSGIKLIDFGGWELPVQFEAGIIEEHMAVRKNAGLFDVSHMGEIMIEGEKATEFVDWLVTNDVKGMKDNQVIYTLMCYPHGGVIDDLLVYKFNNKKYLLVVNAANVEKDFKWITEENEFVKKIENDGRYCECTGCDCFKKSDSSRDKNPDLVDCGGLLKIENISKKVAQLAFQGPNAQKYFQNLVDINLSEITFFTFRDGVDIKIDKSLNFNNKKAPDKVKALVSRTGYTGEDGFEIYLSPEDAPFVWETIIRNFKKDGVLPCGLGARDTLRFEAKLPLYGHEISESITPLEAGLKYFVKLEKEDFCGKEALLKQEETGIPRTLRGIEMVDKGVPRTGYKVFKDGVEIGFVTTGAKSPMLDKFVALVLIKKGVLKPEDTCEVEIGGKLKLAKTCKTPFYKNTGK
ncbi:MAG: glycine cleavage system protein T [Spirochaetes bacterium]|nr:glycine cleavage system protein T [Spirochaetota bacterium]